jgi:hypothetical protein
MTLTTDEIVKNAEKAICDAEKAICEGNELIKRTNMHIQRQRIENILCGIIGGFIGVILYPLIFN